MTTLTLDPPLLDGAQPDHEPWCTEHWEGTEPGDPGTCFATDVTIPFRGDEVEVAMSATPGSEPSLTLFLPSRHALDAPNFTNLAEAETAAYAVLALIARARGDLAASARHAFAAGSAARNGSAR